MSQIVPEDSCTSHGLATLSAVPSMLHFTVWNIGGCQNTSKILGAFGG